ncbi:MAG: hypothetical protein HRF50_01190 [Phycisphaerae bacterium]
MFRTHVHVARRGKLTQDRRLLLLVTLSACALPACAMRIEPPANPQDPVPVVVADYGYHLSLILPSTSGGSVEFAYGWWDWFALNHDRWYNALPLLLLPGKGALGTRTLPCPPSDRGLKQHVAAEGWHELNVEREKAARVRDELQAQYDSARPTEVYNPVVGLYLVHHRRLYTLTHNCNSAVAEWLEALGARVSAGRSIANVDLRPVQPPR